MTLQILWFWVLCLLWTGYFVLEGFDFGVGMLLPVLGREEKDRETLFETIGPFWDGNEVWVLVAGGATFAAFPQWYATMFSGFYLALLLILVLMIVRVLSFEWRERSESPRWRMIWSWSNTIGSVGAPLIWGIALASLLYGTPIDAKGNFTGSFSDLFSWYSVLAGVALVFLFAFHGAVFLTLRTVGDLCDRARGVGGRLGPLAVVTGAGFLVATLWVGIDRNDRSLFPGILFVVLAAVAVIAAVVLSRSGRLGAAFAATATTIVLAVVTLFTMLYPRVMVSSSNFADSLTIDNAASGHYTLTVMTVAVGILLPIVVLYQAWAYHVFRARVGSGGPVRSPVELLGTKRVDPVDGP
jgi:cytochrome d ubiquinol oxidase subunit II